MTYQSQRRDQRSLDLLALDHAPECPYCNELNAAGATVCADCGGHLTPSYTTGPARELLDGDSGQAQEGAIVMAPHDCTCGGNGVCLACYFASFERDPFVESTDRALRALDGHGNVIDLHGYSKKVQP